MKKVILLTLSTMLLVLAGCQKQSIQSYTFTPYLTAGDKSALLQEGISIQTDEANPSIYKITVDTKKKYQTIDGFGAAMSESAAYVLSNLNESKRNEVMEALFGESGIGIDFVRIPMGASDFALNNYTYNDLSSGTDLTLEQFSIQRDLLYVVPRLQQALALNPDLKLMGSPWSAPAWMKSPQKLNGGSLNPIYHAAYADYFVKFIEAYQAQGLPMYAITPQNEPLHETSGYPSMLMTVAQQINFLKVLGPKFEENQIDTKIIGYDHNWDNTFYPQALLNNEDIKPYLDGVAFHCYAGSYTAQQAIQTNHPDRDIWFTECSGGRWATNFGSNISWNLENVFLGSLNYGSRSVLLWNLALDTQDGPQNGGCTNCRGVVTVDGTDSFTLNEEYYMIGHFSKFIDKDARRVDAKSTSPNLLTGSYLNPDGSLVVVAHNKTNADMLIQVDINGHLFNYSLKRMSTVTFDGIPTYA
jgi:glucosylceramidase